MVERCRQGDQRAFRTLVERYQRKVFSLAFGLLKDPDEARDISQEAFLKAHRHIGSFQGTASFYTWLYRITVNLCIDRKRKVGRGSEVELDERLSHRQVGSPADVLSAQKLSFNPQRVAQSSELRHRILEALAQLSEQHRAVLVLREVEGLSYKEIADSMDCPEGTVMSRLFHARRQMQQLLSDFAEDAEQEGAE
ncbi:MAG: sigma-70 family RNA polymerase sigma factor [Myxococcales bacterium]|nr:sigma-70 family RNA polymerase sigma factor [Myxococcales bacterium]